MNVTHLTTPLATAEEKPPVARRGKRLKRELKNLIRRDGVWYFQKFVAGKREFNGRRTPFSLETRDLELAKAKRDKILSAADGVEMDRVLGKQHHAAVSLGAIFEAYRTAPTVRANASTRERNIADLVRMVRAVRGLEFNVEGMCSLELDKQLVKSWQALKIAEASAEFAEDLAKLEAAKRSLNSLLAHVQSIFSRAAVDDYTGIYLPPNVDEFANAFPVKARKQEEPEQLPDEFVSELLAGVGELQKSDPGAWATFHLMTWGGLRNIECVHARVSWLEQVGMGYRLKMKPVGTFVPKGSSRAVILPADIVEAMIEQLPFGPIQAGAKDERHLVPARTATDREEAAYRRLNEWLKAKGVDGDAGKIAYRLRKYFLNKVAEQQGVMLAQAAAGHASMRTTEQHYIGKPKMEEPIRLTAG